jgi:hypothetical protein
MSMTILKNGRTRLAFQFGRASALRSASDVIDQLQAQLDAERKQHAFDVAESEKQIAILIRNLMAGEVRAGPTQSGRDLRQNGESISKAALAQHAVDQTRLFSTHCAQAINASTSNVGARMGVTPNAITNAVMPSIRPVERFFESFLLPAGSRSMTALLAHICNIG